MTRALVVAALTLILLPLNAAGQNWQQGFDFRATAGYVTDPPTATYVLSTTAYPTTRNGVTFGWANTALVQPRDRSMLVDPRLAGINYVNNGAPAKFYVDLPSAGTYNLSLALGDDGYPQCWTQCQVQFLDGNTVVGTVNGGFEGLGFFYDATGKNWSATVWPGSNAPLQVTMNGTRLTVLVGTSNNTGDITPIAFLGVSQTMSVPNFTVTANPTGVSVMQGSQGTSTINTTISGVFNSAITLSTSGVPTGTTVSFSPNPIGAPGSGSSTMTITVGSNTAMGTYPITVTGDGGGIERTTTVTLTVTSPVQPDFTIAVSPNSLLIGQGNQGTSTVTTTIVGGFNSAISLSATGVPTGTTVSFNPNPIAAPGNGSSTMTVMVGASTALGTYPITVTGTGGGTQHSATVTLTVTTAVWQQGFDFRATQGYVTDPPPATYVLSTTAYPTTRNGVSFGWANTALVQSRDRSVMIDPRLAGINYVNNGTPVKFFVDLPSAGTYNLSLAMGDDGYPECWTQCQVQFLDGNTVVGTVSGGFEGLGFFYDAVGKNWSATAWPGSNSPLQVTMNGTRLTVVVGSTNSTGDITTIAFLGITQSSAVPNFTIAANPSSLSVVQGNQGTSTIATTISGGFNSAISLSASGVPPGTTASFNPNPIAAPGSGSSTMTITVGSNTATGTYPIVVKGDGGGVEQQTTVMLTVTMAVQPDFTIAASPNTLLIGQGNQGTSTVTTTIAGGFNNAISLSATGVPTGTSVNFNPNPIAAPGNGSSTMTVMVGANTALGTYPITVTGTGGGTQHSITVTLTVTSAVWQQGFDFRATSTYVTDPPTSTYVLANTGYPTTVNGVTFGWANTALVQSRDRSVMVDPRLAGINYVNNGTPSKFYVDLPSAGTYNLSLALGDDGYPECWTQCQVQFLDGSTVVGTVSGGFEGLGFFYDAIGKNWSATTWPANNAPLMVTMNGTRLTVIVGSTNNTGDITTIAFLGITQSSAVPNFTIAANPSSLTVVQGNQGTSTITTTISGGFNSDISLSASGVPTGTTVSFNPNPIAAPGSGSSMMTIMVGSNTATGTYPITVTGNGGGITQTAPVTLIVTAPIQPDFAIGAMPNSLTIGQGNQGTSTITTTIVGGFNSAISLSATGVPTGTSVNFNPNPIVAPGNGSSTMTVMVGANTALGTYPITVTGVGGGTQHGLTVTLTVTSAVWQQGFDFRATLGFVTDPPTATHVLSTTAYPTTVNGVTFGWANTLPVGSRDRSMKVDARLAGINYVTNGMPATFYVGLPSAGTYNLSLAMGDAGFSSCWTQCQIQFLDGSTVLATVTGGPQGMGFFYDAGGKSWSATAWPTNNALIPLSLTGSKLTVIVGSNNNTGDQTPIAYMGLTQGSVLPSFTLSASPNSLTVPQGTQATSTITATINNGFNSAINLAATGTPTGTTISFNPNPIPAPGGGTSTMTIAVGSTTAVGTYPITITGTGGGAREITTFTLTVAAGVQPDFSISVTPAAVDLSQGVQGTATVSSIVVRGFNNAVSLSATGMPMGTTASFNPNPIAPPGSGTSQMTLTVGSGTPLGTYPITVTGSGGGIQHSATLSLTVTAAGWQRGFDFRNTQSFVVDPPGANSVLPKDLYPTTTELGTYGWQSSKAAGASDRSASVDPRLAGINYQPNGSPGTFYVDLPSSGTYNLSLAMGDAGFATCWSQCQIQFMDGNRVVATLAKGPIAAGNFYDANGNSWPAAAWPANNVPLQVTMTGTELAAVVGTSNNTGDVTPIAYLGVQQVSTAPTFALNAPGTVTVGQGEYSTFDLSTALVGAFNSPIGLSSSGAPTGVTITFNPATIPAPGAGSSVVTISVGSTTALGTYPITLMASGGGVTQNATVMLTVTQPTAPDFSISTPTGIGVASGSHASTTVTTAITGSFNNSISLSATGAPTGATISFNPGSIPAPGAGNSTMTVTTSSNTPLGSYPITVTGTSGPSTHNTTITLTVSTSGSVNLPSGTGWLQLGQTLNFCNENPGTTYFNPAVGAVDALDFLSLCQQGTMVAYGGGAPDTTNDRYFLWTSGHNNYQGNEMYELDLRGSSPTISRIMEPAWTVDNTDVPPDCACRGTINCGQGMWHDGANNLVSTPFSESANGGPKFESIPAPDGSYGQPSCGYGSRFQPNARETYAGLVYDPGRQKLFSWGGVPAADPTSTGMFSNWSLDLLQDPPKWTRLADSSYLWFTAAVYDYTTGHPTSGYDLVYDENQTLYAYSPSTDKYTVLGNAMPYIGYNVNLALDPIHHTLVMENGDDFGGYHLEIVNLDSCNGTSCSITSLDNQTSCKAAMGYWAGVAWDSKRSVMSIFPSSNNCSRNGCIAPFDTDYLLNTDPINPVTITYRGSPHTIAPLQCFAASYGSTQGVDYPPMSVGPGVYSRFAYYPNEDIYLFIPHPDQPIWILRLE